VRAAAHRTKEKKHFNSTPKKSSIKEKCFFAGSDGQLWALSQQNKL